MVPETQITAAIYPLTACQTVGMSQACTHLPPKSHLSLRPPEKNNPRITSRPRRGPCQAFAFIAVRTGGGGGESAEGWQLFEGVEGGGCEGGQCHTKGGQEGKISHP